MSRKLKGKAPSEEQSRILRKEGYNPMLCEVMQDYPRSMIILDRETGRVEVVEK